MKLIFRVLLIFALVGPTWAQNPSPWPAEAVAESHDIRLTGDDSASGATTHASPHFEMVSDVKSPTSVVRDLAAVFDEEIRGLCRKLALQIDSK